MPRKGNVARWPPFYQRWRTWFFCLQKVDPSRHRHLCI